MTNPKSRIQPSINSDLSVTVCIGSFMIVEVTVLFGIIFILKIKPYIIYTVKLTNVHSHQSPMNSNFNPMK